MRTLSSGSRRRKPPRPHPLAEVYGLLEPGPVVLLTTARRGRSNVMTLSWHSMIEFEPPLVGCVVSDPNFSNNRQTDDPHAIGDEVSAPAPARAVRPLRRAVEASQGRGEKD